MSRAIPKQQLALSFGLATAILWVLCSLLVALFPDPSFVIFKWWMHGIDIGGASGFSLNWNNFVLGGITLTLSLMVVGYVLGLSFEIIGKKGGPER